MPSHYSRRRMRKSSKYVTKRSLPFALMKFAEKKFEDTTVVGEVFAAVPSFAQNCIILTDIAQGTGQKARIGNEIQMSGVFLKYICKSTATASNWVRFILYTPRVIGDETLPAGRPDDPIDPDEFVVWDDTTVSLSNVAGGGDGTYLFKKRFKPYMKVIWTGGDGGTDVTKGELILCILAEGQSVCQISGYNRMYYRDV